MPFDTTTSDDTTVVSTQTSVDVELDEIRATRERLEAALVSIERDGANKEEALREFPGVLSNLYPSPDAGPGAPPPPPPMPSVDPELANIKTRRAELVAAIEAGDADAKDNLKAFEKFYTTEHKKVFDEQQSCKADSVNLTNKLPERIKTIENTDLPNVMKKQRELAQKIEELGIEADNFTRSSDTALAQLTQHKIAQYQAVIDGTLANELRALTAELKDLTVRVKTQTPGLDQQLVGVGALLAKMTARKYAAMPKRDIIKSGVESTADGFPELDFMALRHKDSQILNNVSWEILAAFVCEESLLESGFIPTIGDDDTIKRLNMLQGHVRMGPMSGNMRETEIIAVANGALVRQAGTFFGNINTGANLEINPKMISTATKYLNRLYESYPDVKAHAIANDRLPANGVLTEAKLLKNLEAYVNEDRARQTAAPADASRVATASTSGGASSAIGTVLRSVGMTSTTTTTTETTSSAAERRRLAVAAAEARVRDASAAAFAADAADVAAGTAGPLGGRGGPPIMGTTSASPGTAAASGAAAPAGGFARAMEDMNEALTAARQQATRTEQENTRLREENQRLKNIADNAMEEAAKVYASTSDVFILNRDKPNALLLAYEHLHKKLGHKPSRRELGSELGSNVTATLRTQIRQLCG